jgi:ADP-ribose pyrophosphatase
MENSKKQAYSANIFTVWEENVLLPTGKAVKQSWIDHRPTVAIVALNAQHEILLIRQFRNATKQTLWEIPAGTMDHGAESAVICAGRELAEETGFRAENLTELFAGYLLPGYCNEYMHFFLAEGLVFAPLAPDEDEFIEVIPTDFSKALDLLKKGEIIDAKTALGLLLASNYIKSRTKV